MSGNVYKSLRLVTIAALFTLLACTHFSVTLLPDGTTVKESGAPLLSRQGEFVVTHEWLDSANVLHEVRISRNVEENADAQMRMLERLAALIETLALTKAGNVSE